ncbi:hypothetical protein PHYPSEUDO_011949 [Phytophthora pseudosyringae]|uniref:Uncharacterized protein n=1 Tax=Phytophthora pseudosyringae TaxID=221518 RepID=A0A8T1VAY5_9STRA|nr:hypothetical protein PHYPSEUDO_011949 [Phytophthora pseudosyringae]
MLIFYLEDLLAPSDTEATIVIDSGGRGGRASRGADRPHSLGFVSSGESDRGEPGDDVDTDGVSNGNGTSDSDDANDGSGEADIEEVVMTVGSRKRVAACDAD